MEKYEDDNKLGYNINDYLSGGKNIVKPILEKIPIIFDHLLQVGTIEDINNFFSRYAFYVSLEFVRYMVNNGADPSHDEYYVFMMACVMCDYKRIVYFVDECNIDVNVCGSAALVKVMSCIFYAGRDKEAIDCLKFLLDSGCIITDACIEECISNNRGIEPMRLLIQYGIDINHIGKIFYKYHLRKTIGFENIIYLNNFNLDFKQSIDNINV